MPPVFLLSRKAVNAQNSHAYPQHLGSLRVCVCDPQVLSIHCLRASKAESVRGKPGSKTALNMPFIAIAFSLTSKFWCRNRPGDEMKDKYNQFSNSLLAFSDEVVETGEQLYCINMLLGCVTEGVHRT